MSTKRHQILLFAVPFLYFLVVFFLDFNGLYGQDAHRYSQFVSELEAYFSIGAPTGEFQWPVLYPLAGWVLTILTGISSAFALQFLSVLSLALVSVFVYKSLILQKLHSSLAFSLTLLGVLFCPQLLMASVICMSDIFATMWVVLCWYYFIKFRTVSKEGWALLVVVFGTLGVFSRYPVAILVAIPIGFTFWVLFKKGSAYTLLFVLIIGLPLFLLNDSIQAVQENHFINNWTFNHWFQNDFKTIDGRQVYRFPNLIYVTYPFWHPALLGALSLLAVLNFRKLSASGWNAGLLITLLLYLFFLAGLPMQSRRFFIPALPLLLILLGPIFREVKVSKSIAIAVLLISILQVGVGGWYFREYLQMNRFERRLAADLSPYQGAVLYTFYWDSALKSYTSNFEFRNLWARSYRSFQAGQLVLFNESELEKQWRGTNVMSNWRRLNNRKTLELKEQWQNGWKLYEIQ